MNARRGRSRGTGWLALFLIVAVTVAAIVYVPRIWERYGDEYLASDRCTVTVGERTDSKTAEQAENIAIIVAGSMRWGLPARAATIAVATAIQESTLRNIDYGDRDSIGLFQQRPSQGWGSVEEIMDPYYATDRFYEALIKVDGWQDAEITDAAQAVQRSGFPLAYADHEEEGRLWASALTGNGGTVTCDLSPASEPTSTQAFADRVAADFGDDAYVLAPVGVAGTDGARSDTVLRVTGASDAATAALAQWAVAVSAGESVTVADGSGGAWVRAADAVETTPEPGTLTGGDGAEIWLRTSAPEDEG
ncbi:hypothetical protein [Demequina litorisediminis]|uniref:Uncharacterized protein n=1 Tax=Demequina litorisediminis TaxID=1849022 RepID=A0ABQ6IDR0_9MICO|nr:hypothetical protein [Demequina litorisediminis]GMA34878.1 hypothetical protein GCM10025876_10820 [Demequina litorisediminis]